MGVRQNIVAGFNNIAEYQYNPDYLGCIVGRYANRIAGGRYSYNAKIINLSRNDGQNHLHGGVNGFNKKIWDVQSIIREKDCAGVVFHYVSKDGEEGYPGNLDVKVTYLLNQQNQLVIRYHATTDQATPVNLTNHSYFNLSAFSNPQINKHLLQINAAYYTESNEQSLPTGKILPVAETALDFRQPKMIARDLDALPTEKGFNHNFVLDKQQHSLAFAAQLTDPGTGRIVKVYTDQPGLQLYTANYWDGSTRGSHAQFYQQHGAVALETQAFPDSPNHPAFPDTLLQPGEEYATTTIYEFGLVT